MYHHPHVIIKRVYLDKCTIGFARAGDDLSFHFATVELKDLNNEQNRSCIPEGEYFVSRYHSPSKNKVVFQLEDVNNRTYIQIHEGNFCNSLHGCIAPGEYIKDINGDGIWDVANSAVVMKKLLSILPERFLIRIESDRENNHAT